MRIHVVGAAAALVLLAGSVQGQEAGPGTIRSEAKVVTLPGGEAITVTLGYLSVPENRNEPSSRLIEVAFMRIPGLPGATGHPLVFLAGGPGNAAINDSPAGIAGWNQLRSVGDVILVDQRGTGRSRPRLVFGWQGDLPRDQFRSEADGRAWFRRVSSAAADHFRSSGVDLRGYNSSESADDIEALRAALGVDRLNLLGFSYGTHLAFAVIRRHGERIGSAVLVGNEGPDHTLKLPSTMDVQWQKLALMAATDTAIATIVPDLDALLRRVLARLDRAPMVVTIANPRGGGSVQVPVGGDGLRFILRADIGDASDLPVFPRLLYSIDRGETAMLAWFVAKRFGTGTHVMASVMDAASGVSPLRLARIRAEAESSLFKDVSNFPTPDNELAYQVPDLGPGYRALLVSPVRALFLSGTLDWNTPPFQAEEIRWGFPNSSHIIVKNAGHEQVMSHPVVRAAIVRFLQGESVDDMTAGYPPLRFVPLTGYDPGRTHPSVPRP